MHRAALSDEYSTKLQHAMNAKGATYSQKMHTVEINHDEIFVKAA